MLYKTYQFNCPNDYEWEDDSEKGTFFILYDSEDCYAATLGLNRSGDWRATIFSALDGSDFDTVYQSEFSDPITASWAIAKEIAAGIRTT